MAVKPISSPVVIRRSFSLSTTTIRETQLDLGIRPAQSELAQVLKTTLSLSEPLTLTAAVTSAQGDNLARQQWALSTSNGLAAIPEQQYEDGCFWYRWMQVDFNNPAAATMGITRVDNLDPAGVMVFNPPVIVAANSVSLYDILIDSGPLGTAAAFSIEFMYQLVAVDASTLAALLARGDLFL